MKEESSKVYPFKVTIVFETKEDPLAFIAFLRRHGLGNIETPYKLTPNLSAFVKQLKDKEHQDD